VAFTTQSQIHDNNCRNFKSYCGGRNITEYSVKMTKEYYQKNRERILANKKARYEINKDELNAKAREERRLNPELTKLANRVRYELNRELFIERAKARNKRVRAEKKLLRETENAKLFIECVEASEKGKRNEK
jgi:hypothetical protein